MAGPMMAPVVGRLKHALALRLGLTANEIFAKGQEDALVTQLVTLSGVVLICWEHDAIVADIIPKIPVSKGTPPTRWPDRHDQVPVPGALSPIVV